MAEGGQGRGGEAGVPGQLGPGAPQGQAQAQEGTPGCPREQGWGSALGLKEAGQGGQGRVLQREGHFLVDTG